MKIKLVEQIVEVEDDIGLSILTGQVDTDKIIQPVPVLRNINGKEKVVHVEVKVPLRYEEVKE